MVATAAGVVEEATAAGVAVVVAMVAAGSPLEVEVVEVASVAALLLLALEGLVAVASGRALEAGASKLAAPQQPALLDGGDLTLLCKAKSITATLAHHLACKKRS